MYLNVFVGYTHMRLNNIYILSHVQHMLQTLRPVETRWLDIGYGALIVQVVIYVYIRQNMNNIVTSNCRRNWDSFGRIKTPVTE